MSGSTQFYDIDSGGSSGELDEDTPLEQVAYFADKLIKMAKNIK